VAKIKIKILQKKYDRSLLCSLIWHCFFALIIRKPVFNVHYEIKIFINNCNILCFVWIDIMYFSEEDCDRDRLTKDDQ